MEMGPASLRDCRLQDFWEGYVLYLRRISSRCEFGEFSSQWMASESCESLRNSIGIYNRNEIAICPDLQIAEPYLCCIANVENILLPHFECEIHQPLDNFIVANASRWCGFVRIIYCCQKCYTVRKIRERENHIESRIIVVFPFECVICAKFRNGAECICDIVQE